MRAAKAGLHGLFAVYKPPGVPWKGVRDAVETKLLSELNSLERPPPSQQVRFLPSTVEGKDGKELTLTVTQLPVLAEHPLVSGPIFTYLKVGAGHRLDKKSSGVFVLGVGRGNKLLGDVYRAHLSRTYTVRGLFGKATDDFSDTGKLIEKTTFDHITGEKLQRILAVIQGSNHKALLQPPPSPCFCPLRHYRSPKESEEPESSEPLSFSKSNATPRKWTVEQSMGSDYEQPFWRAMLISLTIMAFLLWCVLRPETEIDRILDGTLQLSETQPSPSEPQPSPSEQEKP
ncbi:pseudouridylate synthase TRUB2, mitochondrial isoform X2 [Eublepharis macularius]|uniref:Pseudouridylate synthase TRUB2, mitochondrial isoform X2 n=1 Tax=Eublepharis macularius TaxID=481883 RepID=A0AA97LIZ4_EUBMA|nr:pseudouridylate synthase TRUB2, mitochondrial isoform X2 [Eublepharis macularius]